MRNHSKELYSKFKTRVLAALESDRFHENFMKAVESGVRFYDQKNELLIKEIDAVWVNALHSTIPALDDIVNRPRKTIEREEVIVPVELARKVGADSVKHLATHTHFISQIDEAGNVIPNKIMNIYNEESYNLYENRFIVTLIQRACEFVDQRYDVVKEMTGNEFQSALKVDSTFSDNGEKVDYNLSLKLHQGAAYLDSENDSAAILEKIEHIRLMYTSFKRSEFFQSMVGCTRVKSPIARTNLIMKNPQFKECYDLWGFLEKYTEPGYSVEQHRSDGDFDFDYVSDLNTMILFNYLIMKNNLEDAYNRPTALTDKEVTVIEPKFQTKVIEETVPDYDIPKVELEQVPEKTVSVSSGVPNSREDAILAALAKVLAEERILNALEKALAAIFGPRPRLQMPAEPDIPAPPPVESTAAIEPDVSVPAPTESEAAVVPDVSVPAPAESEAAVVPDVSVPAPAESEAAIEPDVSASASAESTAAIEPDVSIPAPAESEAAIEPDIPAPAPAESTAAVVPDIPVPAPVEHEETSFENANAEAPETKTPENDETMDILQAILVKPIEKETL